MAIKTETVALSELVPDSRNARRHNGRNIEEIKRSLEEFEQHRAFVVQRGTNKILIGNGMYEAMKALGWKEAEVYFVDDDDRTAIRRALADNRTADLAEWDNDILDSLIHELGDNAKVPGWTDDELRKMRGELEAEELRQPGKTLAERFGVPPFSVLDSGASQWQARKKAWLSLGIKSEAGRGGSGDAKGYTGGTLFKSVTTHPKFYAKKQAKERELGKKLTTAEFIEKYYDTDFKGLYSGTSIFDPVLCELVYRWFSKEGDTVLDPFAGGSVRGVVASRLKRPYFGVDLRPEQIDANRQQLEICHEPLPTWFTGDSAGIQELTGGLQADLVFSCPPYVDLEVYSDSPDDLSNMAYPDFLDKYRAIIRNTCQQLKDNRFACFVVGEVRDKKGNYYGFVPDTIQAFHDAGLHFYNDAILITGMFSAAIRAGKHFETGRKLCKVHQNVLVFVKGESKKAAARLGQCDFGSLEDELL